MLFMQTMAMTLPNLSTMGPPLLPGFTLASVRTSAPLPWSWELEETMPRVIFRSAPSSSIMGKPMTVQSAAFVGRIFGGEVNERYFPVAIDEADDGEVIFVVDGDDFDGGSVAVLELDVEEFCILGDVAVGEDEPVGGDEETCAAPASDLSGAGSGLLGRRFLWRGAAGLMAGACARDGRGEKPEAEVGGRAGDVVLRLEEAGRFEGGPHFWEVSQVGRGDGDGRQKVFGDFLAVLNFSGGEEFVDRNLETAAIHVRDGEIVLRFGGLGPQAGGSGEILGGFVIVSLVDGDEAKREIGEERIGINLDGLLELFDGLKGLFVFEHVDGLAGEFVGLGDDFAAIVATDPDAVDAFRAFGG